MGQLAQAYFLVLYLSMAMESIFLRIPPQSLPGLRPPVFYGAVTGQRCRAGTESGTVCPQGDGVSNLKLSIINPNIYGLVCST